jgi:hypothetical protein
MGPGGGYFYIGFLDSGSGIATGGCDVMAPGCREQGTEKLATK